MMDVQLERIVELVTQLLDSEGKINTVIGKEFQLGEYSVVPVMRFGMGFGTGGRKMETKSSGFGDGFGAGGGMGLEPLGFLVSKGNHIEFISTRTHKGLDFIFEKVPHLIERFMDSKEKDPADDK